MAGSRYTVEVNVAGNSQSAFYQIGYGIGRVYAQLQKLGSSTSKAGSAMEGMAGMMKAQVFMEIANAIDGVSSKLLGLSQKIQGFSQEFVQGIVTDAAKFQDAESSMRFAFGEDKWAGMYDKVLKESAKLTFTFEQTMGLASSLGAMKINPFGTTNDQLEVFKSRTGQAVSAMEVLQDTADAAGRDANQMVFALKEAMSDDWVAMKDAANLTKKDVEAWKKEMNKATDIQGKYNKLIQLMADRFGGAGALRAKNFNKTIAQIPDILQQIRAAVGKSGLETITAAIARFVETLGKMAKDKELLDTLASGFQRIASIIAWAIDAGTGFLAFLGHLIKKAPWLPTVAAGFLAIAFATSLAAGAGLSMVASILAIGAAVSTIGLPAILGAVVGAVILLPVAIALLGGVIGLVAGSIQALQSNVGGLSGTFEKISVIYGLVMEFFETFDGKTFKMSADTRNAIKEMGLEGLAKTVIAVANNVWQFVDAFKSGFKQLGNAIGPQLMATLNSIVSAILAIGRSLGLLNTGTNATNMWRTAAQYLVYVMASVANGILKVVQWGAQITKTAADWGFFSSIVNATKNTLQILLIVGRQLGGVLGTSFKVVGVLLWVAVSAIEEFSAKILMVLRFVEALVNKITRLTGSVRSLVHSTAESAVAGNVADASNPTNSFDQFQSMMAANEMVAQQDKINQAVMWAKMGVTDGSPRAVAADMDGLGPYGPGGTGVDMADPSHVLPNALAGAGAGESNEKVVSALGELKSLLANGLKNQKGDTIVLQIDGQKVAEVIKGQEAARGGR